MPIYRTYINTFIMKLFKTFPSLCYPTTNATLQDPYVIPCLLLNNRVRDWV